MNQMRYDTGKPKLHYFYSNQRAYERLDRFAKIPADECLEDSRGATERIVSFLARDPADDFGLEALAVWYLEKLSGVELGIYEMSAAELLVRCVKGVDAYCSVCEFGERKYSRGNYRLGQTICHYLDSTLRHQLAFDSGELLDPESGYPHLAHAFWNVWQALDQPDWRDDRLNAVNTEEPT